MPRADEVSPDLLRDWPLPTAEGSKSDRGDVHVVGGAAATPGAILLAGLAALRVGAGRLAITTVREVQTALAVAVPEAAVYPYEDLDSGREPKAYVVGPGILEPGDLVARVRKLCDTAALVVDAVALHDLPDDLPSRTVVTPNGKELRSLADRDGEDIDLVVRVSGERGVVVASGGYVAAPDGRL